MIIGIVEHDGNVISDSSFETLTLARGLAQSAGTSLEAVLIGSNVSGMADSLKDAGVSKVHLIEDGRLEKYAPVAVAKSVSKLVEAKSPTAITAPGTDRGWGSTASS